MGRYSASGAEPAAGSLHRLPMVVELGPRDLSLRAWVCAAGDEPAYRVVKRKFTGAMNRRGLLGTLAPPAAPRRLE